MMDPRIADYIRANRKKLTRQAIRKQLLDAGHDPQEIDATWAALEAPDADDTAGPGFWRRFWIYLLGANVAVFLLVGLLTGMLAAIPGGGGILAFIFVIVLGIGALIAWAVVGATRPTTLSPTTATVIGIVIPLVFALLVGGSCFALVGTVGMPPPPAQSGLMQVQLGAPLNIDGSVEAQCQPPGQGSEGFSVYANLPGPDGPRLDISLNAFPQAPGGPPAPMVFIAVAPTSESDPGMGWGTDMGPGADVELDASPDGLTGTVRFTALAGMEMPDAPTEEPLTGELTWTCE